MLVRSADQISFHLYTASVRLASGNSNLETVKENERTAEQRRASTAKIARPVRETPYGNFMMSVLNQLIVPLGRVRNKPNL